MIFLPRNNYEAQENARTLVESELTKSNFNIYGWRQVPVNTKVLGEKANFTRPEITQVLFKNNDKSLRGKDLERKLYESRRKIEKEAIKNAKKTGIGLVAVRKSGHYGLSSFYAEQAVKKNLIVFCFTNAPPALAPHGAKKSLFGTNPICFGVPTGKVPFILDASKTFFALGI